MASKLNLSKANRKLAEDFKKAEQPTDWIDKAGPGTKATTGKEAAPAKSTVNTKYATSGKPKFGNGKVSDPGKPSDNYMKNDVPKYEKRSKYAPKLETKDVPKPSMSGFEGAAGETLGKARYYEKTTAIQQNELVNGFLKGMGPKAASFVTMKSKVASGPRTKAYPIKSVKEGKGQLFSPNGPSTYMIKEGVMNGTLILSFGAKRLVFEGAAVAPVASFVKSLTELGQKVNIDFIGGFRSSYDNRELVETVLKAVHAGRCGQKTIRDEFVKEAYTMFRTLLLKEYNEFLYETKAEWSAKAVKPAFKQMMESFSGMYDAMCKPYMVSVNASTSKGDELFRISARSISESHAAAQAVEKIMETTGPSTSVRGIRVDAKKYAPETVKAASVIMPKFIDNEPGFDMASKANMKGKRTESPEVKAPTATVYKGAKGKAPAGVKSFRKMDAGGPAKKVAAPK